MDAVQLRVAHLRRSGFTHRPVVSLLALIVSAILLLNELAGCPFCLSPPQTFAEQMNRADIALIAELIRFRVLDFGTRAESTLRIREYLRGDELAAGHRELAIGQCLVTAADYSAQPGDMFLMYGDLPYELDNRPASTFTQRDAPDAASDVQSTLPIRTVSMAETVPSSRLREFTQQFQPWLIEWNDTTAVSSDTIDYLRRMPDVSLPQDQRLWFYMSYLEHTDAALAIDAWAEFANSKYEDVRAVRSLMPRDGLKRWIADPLCSPDRLGLYGMMLGLCGAESDAEFLRQQMHEPDTTSLRFGADGLMGGYILLAGSHALTDLDAVCAGSNTGQSDSKFAFAQAMSFMQSYEPDRISMERLRQSMRMFLVHESIRETAITHLARWQDWDALPTLVAMFDRDCADDRMTQRAIIQFAQVCVAPPSGAATVSDSLRTTAETFLSQVKRTHQTLLPE